ncbi:MAG: O-antigen ligase family protein, partial [Chloroflexi bacterium]|nr:O-antigen ligase family protein [Chloroflexota bacterium]
AVAAVTALGVAVSVTPRVSLLGSYQRLQGAYTTASYLAAFGAVYANLRRKSQMERLVNTVILTSLPIAIYGILQHYGLDPIPWGGNTTDRVTGNLGNAIFIGAYMIMACLLGAGRLVQALRTLLSPASNFQSQGARLRAGVLGALYGSIFAGQLIAIYFSGSRGPWLGLLAGLYFFSILLAARARGRGPVLAILGLSLLVAAFIGVLNIPGGPLEALRSRPLIGRLGRIFETQSDTGRVRVLIWEGDVKLMLRPHPALQYPDGRTDALNPLRPLIGYGLEALYVAFNPFYPPELAYIEHRNASPDRSHNETWDALVFGGALGLGVYLALYAALFYYGLKWLGFMASAGRRNLFLGLYLAGGVAGVLAAAWVERGSGGLAFIGVGLPSGILLGLLLFLALTALFPERGTQPATGAATQPILLAALLGALVAHFTEVHFGISVASTRLYFWALAGALAVLGQGLVGDDPVAVEDLRRAARRSRKSPAGKRRKGGGGALGGRGGALPHPTPSAWLRPALQGGLLLSGIMLILGFDFVNNSIRLNSAGAILARALTRLSTQGYATSYGVLAMLLITWAAGSVLFWLAGEQGENWRSLAATAGVSAGAAFVALPLFAARVAAIARQTPGNLAQLVQVTDQLAGIFGLFYGLSLLLVAALALSLIREWPARLWNPIGGAGAGPVLTGALYGGLAAFAVLLGLVSNARLVQADIVFKAASSFDNSSQPQQAAIALYEHAVALAPDQDFYLLFLGRAYLQAANTATAPAEKEGDFQKARASLERAQQLNPLNTDHTANLARLYSNWARATTDAALRSQRAQQSDSYYQAAVRLSPNNSTLWNEWAVVQFDLLGNAAAAQQYFDRSLAMDPNYDQTQNLLGQFYELQAAAGADAQGQAALFARADAAYQKALELARDDAGRREAHTNLASLYVRREQYPAAIEENLALLELNPPQSQLWQIHRALANLYRLTGDLDAARQHAQLALQSAPDDQKAELQALIDSLGK